MSYQQNQRRIKVYFKLDCCPYENEWEIRNSSRPFEVVASRDYTSSTPNELETDIVYLDGNTKYTLRVHDRNGDGLQNGYYKVMEGDITLAQGSGNFGYTVEHSLQPEVMIPGGNEADRSISKITLQSTTVTIFLIFICAVLYFIGYTMMKTRQKGIGVKASRRDTIIDDLGNRPPENYDIPTLIKVRSIN
mmetsp:Transcript_30147/g.35848  ORF Transcript_30147/g.35848 Transcript_30147/m.35848 type:complete len:191 (+) Transcript_30147:45-617(+)